MDYLEIKAPAKINIGLYILNKRSDGFHNLSTLFYPVCDLYDKLTFKKSFFFSFNQTGISIPDDGHNLVIRAKDILENFTSKKLNVAISLEKNIPVGAGLGGGSSDAATALVSLNEYFSLNLNHDQLVKLALELGSDVPFFLKSKPSIGSSRGEILKEVDLEIAEFILLVNPNIHISTKDAFSHIIPENVDFNYMDCINDGRLDFRKAKEHIRNDFEDFAFSKHTEIKNIKEKMYAAGSLFAMMSGSGSTVYGIFDDIDKAESVKADLPGEYFSFLSNLSN